MFGLKELPSTISGFGSSLFALHSMFPSLKFHSFDLRTFFTNESDIHAANLFLKYAQSSTHINLKTIPHDSV